MSRTWKRLLSVVLTIAMILSLTVPAYAADSGSSRGVTWEKIENSNPGRRLTPIPEKQDAPLYADNENVRVSIVLSKKATIDAGFSTKNIAENVSAMNYRQQLQNEQTKVTDRISKRALDGAKLDVVWNMTLVANIISANVEYGQIDKIKAVPGVKDVILETRYEPAVVGKDADNPNMSNASEMTGGNLAWAAGYTGAGSKIAIVDTGLDIDHIMYSGEALEYALEKDGLNVDLMDEDDIAAVWDKLNASEFLSSTEGIYHNAKVAYGVNYVDRDVDVTHLNDTQEEHGSHVAGIAAANRYIPVEGYVDTFAPAISNVYTQGEAPDAQLLIMKVFGKGGGAYDSDYMVAIEDAIILGADSVNLSLGSSVAGWVTSDGYQEIMDSIVNSDTVVSISAGNSYSWQNYAEFPYLYSDDANFDTVGSPGSFTNSLAVASVDNDGFTGAYLTAYGENIFYTESAGYGNEPMTSIAGTYDFIYVDGPGVDDNNHVGQEGDAFMAVGKDAIEGKIAICDRGTSSFFAKANAAAQQGAVGVIVGNNQPGTINMNLQGYTETAPVVSITQADANFLKENGEKSTINGVDVYTGTITVGSGIGAVSYGSEYYTMSEFSSWGVPGDLSMKPEITAPGGNIYSVMAAFQSSSGGMQGADHKSFENMSGTSMAAPQIAGLAAVLAQYIRENDLTAKTGLTQRALINSLLMSTSEPLYQEDSGSYFSILKQGSGLADVNAAINANSYILMNEDSTASYADGKVKVELGDDPDRTGEYEFSFNLNNLTDEELDFGLNADFFTQDVFAYYVMNGDKRATDADGNPVIATYLDDWTAPLDSTVTFYADGKELVDDPGLDFNGDGVFDELDAKALLELIVNGTELYDDTGADMNEDGEINTYDAYLALELASRAHVTVPADGSVEIKVHVVLNDIADYDDAGAYVEGFVYVDAGTDEEGNIGTKHSIPVLGYYGSWSEPSMIDRSDYISYTLGEDLRTPYMKASGLGDSAFGYESFTINYAGLNGTYRNAGNPFGMDTDADGNPVYLPERNSVSTGSTIGGYQYSLIRNAAAGRVLVTDEEGNTLNESEMGKSYAAYYQASSGAWQSYRSSVAPSYKVGDLEEGTKLNVTFQLVPEYYVDAEGNVDWDSVNSDNAPTIPMVVDNTAPEIEEIFAGVSSTEKANGLTIKLSENRYIASIAVWNEAGWNDTKNGAPLIELGADVNETEGAGRTVFIKSGTEDGQIDLTAKENQHLLVQVDDYALNESTYKLNLNIEELEAGVQELTISPESAKLVPGTSTRFTVAAEPWGTNDAVTWSTGDEAIATVDKNGIVTAVEEGTTTVTATSVENPGVSATANIIVEYIENEFNAVVWDENGQVWLSEINTKNVTKGADPLYTKMTENPIGLDIVTMSWDADGETVYAAELDNDFNGQLYTFDPATYEFTPVGDLSEIAFLDMVPSVTFASALGNEEVTMMSAYGNYIVGVNTTTGQYEGALNMANYIQGSYIVGLAYDYADNSAWGSDDYFYMVDDLGYVYSADFWYTSFFGMYPFVSTVGKIGEAIDTDHFNDLYFDAETGRLFWTRFNNGDNRVDLICLDSEVGMAYNLGNFGDSVWPVAGMIQLNGGSADAGNRVDPNAAIKASGDVSALGEPAEILKTIEKLDRNATAKGTTNLVNLSEREVVRPTAIDAAEADDYSTATVEVKADAVNNNGLYTAEYDADALELVSATSEIDMNVINSEEAGKVVIGYATLDEVAEGDTVLTLVFKEKYDDRQTTVTVTNDELNDEKPSTEEEITLGHAHEWDAPVWTWSEDFATATAKFICKTNTEHVQEIEATVTKEVTDPTCEENGTTVYTATVVGPDGETYTDKQADVTDASGHEWGEPEWTWSADKKTAKVTFTCKKDENHRMTVDATVTETTTGATCDKAGQTVYTGTATGPDGKTYTDTQTETIPALGHEWGEPEWTWSSDKSTATATFTCKNCGEKKVVDAKMTKTTDENGMTTYTATVDGPDGNVYTDTAVVGSAKTGDTFPIGLYVGVMAICVAGAAFVLLRGKKKED